jgi:hypothetical protein
MILVGPSGLIHTESSDAFWTRLKPPIELIKFSDADIVRRIC